MCTEFLSTPTDDFNGTCPTISIVIKICNCFRPIFLSLICTLCVCGIIGNSLNILIFTHKSFISSTNILIAGISLSDLLCQVAYLYFVLFFREVKYSSRSEAVQQLILINSMNFFHTFTCYMLVALGIYRVLYVKAGNRASTIYTMRTAFLAILLVTIATLVMIIPYIICHKVEMKDEKFFVDYEKDDISTFSLFFSQSVMVKGIPCLILAFCSGYLINFIVNSQKLRKKLTNTNTNGRSIIKKSSPNGFDKHDEHKSDIASKNILYMLLSIMLLYIFTYLPQTIITLVTYRKACMMRQYYDPLGELFDTLTLIDGSAGFLFYICLSRPYRKTASLIFLRNSLTKTPPPQTTPV